MAAVKVVGSEVSCGVVSRGGYGRGRHRSGEGITRGRGIRGETEPGMGMRTTETGMGIAEPGMAGYPLPS
jgi:hypothetical protein